MEMVDLSANIALLQDLSGEHFYYCPNRGNAGDSAIACATYLAFDRFGCNYSIISPTCDPAETAGKIVVYAGGGNFVRYYQEARVFLEAHHRNAKKIVLLPHSIDGHKEVLAGFGPNVHLYCRDRTSFDYALNESPHANVKLAHDMVFMLDVAEVLNSGGQLFGRIFPSRELRWRNTKRFLRIMKYTLLSGGRRPDLYAFRSDVEKTSKSVPFSNIDISQSFAADDMSPANSMEATFRVLEFLNQFERIHTNRLHVGILSALLGRRVVMYDNSYGKNRNIYMHSLRDFGNVEWRDSEEFPGWVA